MRTYYTSHSHIHLHLFPTRLLTSEDEYKWYWHQMIYFPETINTISTLNTIADTLSLVSSKLCTLLTLCMLASRSRGEVVFLSLLSSSHSLTTCHVLSLPLSGLNWPSLFPLWGLWPPFPKMASPFTGSAHPPFPGSSTTSFILYILLLFSFLLFFMAGWLPSAPCVQYSYVASSCIP
jgi:hypothetical protein